MISHRGISVITPLPLGEGKGEGPVRISAFSIYSFLTELHRRTEYTKAHRDIKSTDDTEPFSQRQQ